MIVTTPAGQGIRRLEGASVVLARTDLLEAPDRRGTLAVKVGTPAGQGVVCFEGAGMNIASADLLETPS